jgi:hypothetical protein
MILHFSHIGLTDGRTFMIPFGSVISEPALAAAKGAAATGRRRAGTPRARTTQTFYDSKGAVAGRTRRIGYGPRMGEHADCDLIRRLYAARARDDREGVRAILHDDVRWHDPYPPPHGGGSAASDAFSEGGIDG